MRRLGHISAFFHKRGRGVNPGVAIDATECCGYDCKHCAECDYRKRNIRQCEVIFERLFAVVDCGFFFFFRLVGELPSHFFVVEIVVFFVSGD